MPPRTCLIPIRVVLRGAPNAANLSQMSDAVARAISSRLGDAAMVMASRDGTSAYQRSFAPPTFSFSGQPMDAGLQRRVAVALEQGIARAVSSFPPPPTPPSAPTAIPPLAVPPSPPIAIAPPPPPILPPPPPPPPAQLVPAAPPRLPLAAERDEVSWRLNGVLVFAIETPEDLPDEQARVDIEPAYSTKDDGRSQLEITVRRNPNVAVTLLPGALPALAHLASEILVTEVVVRPPPLRLYRVPDAWELQVILARERGEPPPMLAPKPPYDAAPDETFKSSVEGARAATTQGPAPVSRHTESFPPLPDRQTADAPGDPSAAPGPYQPLHGSESEERRLGRWVGATEESVLVHEFESKTLLTDEEHDQAVRRLMRQQGLILPYRKRATSGARASPIFFTRLPGGIVRVRSQPAGRDDPDLRFPPTIGEGVLLRQADLVGVKLLDEGEEIAYLPALLLPLLQDDETRATLLKMARADRVRLLLQEANSRVQALRRWLTETWPESGGALVGSIEQLVVRPPAMAAGLSGGDRRRAAGIRRSLARWREQAGSDAATLSDDRRRDIAMLEADITALMGALRSMR